MNIAEAFSAVYSNENKKLKKLLDNNLDPNITGIYGETLLSLAASNGNIEIIDTLLDAGADINKPNKNDSSYTPLTLSLNGKINVLKHLIKKGANIECKDAINRTPIFHAAIHGNYEAANVLIESGAKLNIKTADNNWTPLHFVCHRYGEWKKLRLRNTDEEFNINEFILSKQNINSLTNDIDKKLVNQYNITKLFIERRADVNAVDINDKTPFFIAIVQQATELAQLFINNGANINHLSKKESITPLMHAAINNDIESVNFLLKNNIDINFQNNDGCTALIFASYNGNLETTKLLVSNGAQTNLKLKNNYKICKKDMTAYDIAKFSDHHEICTILCSV